MLLRFSFLFLGFGARGEVLKKMGTEWEYLFAVGEDGLPVDPEAVDDGLEGWADPTISPGEGPVFRAGTAPIGYGDGFRNPLATNVWQALGNTEVRPPAGSQKTV